jgi:hypothetical protein
MSASGLLRWVIFEKKNRSRSGIITAVAYPKAIELAAERTGKRAEEFDFSPVYDYESDDEAKARVAGSIE